MRTYLLNKEGKINKYLKQTNTWGTSQPNVYIGTTQDKVAVVTGGWSRSTPHETPNQILHRPLILFRTPPLIHSATSFLFDWTLALFSKQSHPLLLSAPLRQAFTPLFASSLFPTQSLYLYKFTRLIISLQCTRCPFFRLIPQFESLGRS